MKTPASDPFDHRARYAADMLRTLARADAAMLEDAGLSEGERFALNRAARALSAGTLSADDYRLIVSLAGKLSEAEA